MTPGLIVGSVIALIISVLCIMWYAERSKAASGYTRILSSVDVSGEWAFNLEENDPMSLVLIINGTDAELTDDEKFALWSLIDACDDATHERDEWIAARKAEREGASV